MLVQEGGVSYRREATGSQAFEQRITLSMGGNTHNYSVGDFGCSWGSDVTNNVPSLRRLNLR